MKNLGVLTFLMALVLAQIANIVSSAKTRYTLITIVHTGHKIRIIRMKILRRAGLLPILMITLLQQQ